jgi:hypothetical protein
MTATRAGVPADRTVVGVAALVAAVRRCGVAAGVAAAAVERTGLVDRADAAAPLIRWRARPAAGAFAFALVCWAFFCDDGAALRLLAVSRFGVSDGGGTTSPSSNANASICLPFLAVDRLTGVAARRLLPLPDTDAAPALVLLLAAAVCAVASVFDCRRPMLTTGRKGGGG